MAEPNSGRRNVLHRVGRNRDVQQLRTVHRKRCDVYAARTELHRQRLDFGRYGRRPAVSNNGVLIPSIGQNGVFSFTFSSVCPTYSVTVTPPPGETCNVTNPTGTANPSGQAPVSNVWISCQPTNSTPAPPRWTPLAQKAPGGINNAMLLLTDGTVMVQTAYQTWYRLTPDKFGSYINGTFAPMAQSNCGHGQFASQVLMDGRVFIAGGELPGGTNPASTPTCPVVPPNPSTTPPVLAQNGTGVETEIYDPVADTWSAATPPTSLIDPNTAPQGYGPAPGWDDICPAQSFQDMISERLDDGRILMAPVCPMKCGDTLIFDPTTYDASIAGSGWSFAGTLAHTGGTEFSCSQQETTWVQLQDGSVLTVDPPTMPGVMNQTSERYSPTASQWVPDQALGFTLFDNFYGWDSDGELGQAFLLPNGQALFIGGASVYGIYTPAAKWFPSLWRGYVLAPNGPATVGVPLAADDRPGAMMVNGKVLLALNYEATSTDVLPTPWFFYEYDPSSNTFAEVTGPGNPNAPSVWTDCGAIIITMLDLPDGTVLMPSGCDNTQLYVYQPVGPPLAQGQPTISSVTANRDGSYHFAGTGLNGISEGASFGDDAQMATNYPLVRLTDSVGHVTYARTYNWSSSGVMTGSTPESTEFTLPATILQAPSQHYSLQVVANGNPSQSISFTAGTCVPQCTNARRGAPNGCGGFCAGTCVPQCANATCGASDGCGGFCASGSCPRHTNETCKFTPATGYMCMPPAGGH